MSTPRTIALSYSRIRTFKTCPKQFYYKHVMRMTEPESDAMRRGSAVHKALENYMNGDPMLDTTHLQEAIVPKLLGFIDEVKSAADRHEAEAQYAFTSGWRRLNTWFDVDVFWRSQIDWTGWASDASFAFSIDWKTGKRRMDETQLWTNAMAKFLAEPRLQSVSEAFVWLDQGCSVDAVVFTRKDADDAVAFVERVSDEIEQMNSSNEWTTTPGTHCRWCLASAICKEAQP